MNNKVYLVINGHVYDGDVVIGIYSSLTKATKAAEEAAKRYKYTYKTVGHWQQTDYNYIKIKEYTLNSGEEV